MKTGRISSIVGKTRSDWSKLTKQLKTLQPSETLVLPLPSGISTPKFRSTILTIGNRQHTGDWRVCTLKHGNKLHCYLAPR